MPTRFENMIANPDNFADWLEQQLTDGESGDHDDASNLEQELEWMTELSEVIADIYKEHQRKPLTQPELAMVAERELRDFRGEPDFLHHSRKYVIPIQLEEIRNGDVNTLSWLGLEAEDGRLVERVERQLQRVQERVDFYDNGDRLIRKAIKQLNRGRYGNGGPSMYNSLGEDMPELWDFLDAIYPWFPQRA